MYFQILCFICNAYQFSCKTFDSDYVRTHLLKTSKNIKVPLMSFTTAVDIKELAIVNVVSHAHWK